MLTTAAHDHNPAHAARGAQLVMDAVVRVLVRDGLDGLSVRRVAAEAGISIGAVQVLLQSWAESSEDSVSHSLIAAACGRSQAVSKTRLTITASGFGCP